jgi:hypothetical protein
MRQEGIRIFTNQVGYDLSGPKRAVARAPKSASVTFAVLSLTSGEPVQESSATFQGPVSRWRDWNFWTLDFSKVRQAGIYLIRLDIDGTSTCSQPFEIGKHLLVRRTLSDVIFHVKSQRCSGKYQKADKRMSFFGERAERADVSGGWYDASGDTSKYLSHLSYANFMNPQQTPAVVWCLLDARSLLTNKGTLMGPELEHRLIDEALHGADFLVRMQDPEGYFYTTVFDRWSKDPDKRMICSYSTQKGVRSDDYQAAYRQGGGMSIAALARASKLTEPGGSYAADDYLYAAERGFQHLEENNTRYLDSGEENIIDDYCALLAASELYQATGEGAYLAAAQKRANGLVSRLAEDENYSGWWRANTDGTLPFFHAVEAGMPIIALLRFLEVTGRSSTQEILAAVRTSLEFELEITQRAVNPFGYARQYTKPLGEEPRSAFFYPHNNHSGYWWQGENARLASLSTAASKALDWIEDSGLATRLKTYSANQLNWILGLNPFDICMLQGHGRNNPEYELDLSNSPGGIANGITAGYEDEDDIDFLPDLPESAGDNRWRWSEQWLPHAAWYLEAIAAASTDEQANESA